MAAVTHAEGEACEFTIGNLVVEDPSSRNLWTPPVGAGCLPGVLRGALVGSGAVCEAPLGLRAWAAAGGWAWLVSVRGWLPVALEWGALKSAA